MEEARSLNTFFRPITDKRSSRNFPLTGFSEVRSTIAKAPIRPAQPYPSADAHVIGPELRGLRENFACVEFCGVDLNGSRSRNPCVLPKDDGGSHHEAGSRRRIAKKCSGRHKARSINSKQPGKKEEDVNC